jgi:nucleoside-diphosphate kinase
LLFGINYSACSKVLIIFVGFFTIRFEYPFSEEDYEKMRTAFVILKPDCIARGLVGEVLRRLEAKGFDIIRMRMVSKNLEWANQHYAHLPPGILDKNSFYMAGSRLIGVVLQGPDRIAEQIKRMVGPTDSADADPGTIRGDLGGQPIRFNVIHCSDHDKVDVEINAFFDRRTDYDDSQ